MGSGIWRSHGSGVQLIQTLSLNLDPSLQPEDVVTSTMQVEDTVTSDTTGLSATFAIGYDMYMPVVFRNYPAP